jgi:hypothetical protein
VTDLVNQLINDHLNADPDREHAHLHDPQFHAHTRLLLSALSECDQALEATGRSVEQRRHLLTVLLSGPPCSDAAFQRLQDHAARVSELDRTMCPPIMVSGAGDLPSARP